MGNKTSTRILGSHARIQGLWALLLCGLLVGLFACGRDTGDEPFTRDAGSALGDLQGLDSAAAWGGGGLRISVNPATLKATAGDQAQVSVSLFDENHNPVAGKEVIFAASHGVIAGSATTDAMGMASVSFQSEPFQGDAYVGAAVQIASDSVLRVARKVFISGLALQLVPAASDVQTGTRVKVQAELLDAAGNPLPDQTIALSGDYSQKLVTDGAGRASFEVLRDSQDTVNLSASALGASATAAVRFWTTVPSGAGNQVTGIRSMRLFSSRSQLRADNSDAATVTAILVNESNNPAVGDTVYFSSNLGVIGGFALVDSTGRAQVTLRSAPVSGTCGVVAKARQGTVSDSLAIGFTGLNLTLQSPSSSVRAGTYVDVQASLQDASQNPIGGDQIVFTITGGTFKNGTSLFTTQLDGNGKATASVTSASAGTVVVRAGALNVSDTVALVFTRDLLSLQASKSWLRVGGADSLLVSATYTDNAGKAIAGAKVNFYTNAGVIAASSVTSALGVATAVLKSASFSGTATVQAIAANASAELKLDMRASSARNLKLSVSPDNIGINGGEASLVAEVTDSAGNTVSGETVSFRLLQGPGGGEAIGSAVGVTTAGEAKSTLLAGSRPSSYRGVLVQASTAGGHADTVMLTLSGLPYTVTVSRPQDDTVVVPNAGQMDKSVFRFNVGAVVQDVNGNPVADGTPVHFSAVVSGMAVYSRYLVEWTFDEGIPQATLGYKRLDVPFEDINNNLVMDPAIDLKLDFDDGVARRGDDADGDGVVGYNPDTYDFWYDFNLNGRCDPGVGEPFYDSTFTSVYADLDGNGFHTPSELILDHDGDGACDLPANGDFRYWLWERLPMWQGVQFNFDHNDQAVVIAVSATTVAGVAQTTITYPRQLARRLFATVNAEANGVRDGNGERFILPVISGN